MKAAVVYSTLTGNTKKVAEAADGEVISLSSVVKKAARYKVLTTDLVPTNFAALAGRVLTAVQLAALTNSLPSVSLGCGWRGPYCEEKSVLDGDGVLRDGFGGLWECDVKLEPETLSAITRRIHAGRFSNPASMNFLISNLSPKATRERIKADDTPYRNRGAQSPKRPRKRELHGLDYSAL